MERVVPAPGCGGEDTSRHTGRFVRWLFARGCSTNNSTCYTGLWLKWYETTTVQLQQPPQPSEQDCRWHYHSIDNVITRAPHNPDEQSDKHHVITYDVQVVNQFSGFVISMTTTSTNRLKMQLIPGIRPLIAMRKQSYGSRKTRRLSLQILKMLHRRNQ
jgi:hypothetical protein